MDMETKNVLEKFKQQSIAGADADSLVDITNVKIDTDKPIAERIKSFIGQIGNPYLFKVDNTVVKVSFNDKGPTLQKCLEKVFTA